MDSSVNRGEARLIVAGSRSITDWKLVQDRLDHFTQNLAIEAVITGGARGVDRLGDQWAQLRGLGRVVYQALWDEEGRSAGYIRNERMANDATHLIAFWDGKSRGTKHMIDIARKRGLQVRIVRTDIGEEG